MELLPTVPTPALVACSESLRDAGVLNWVSLNEAETAFYLPDLGWAVAEFDGVYVVLPPEIALQFAGDAQLDEDLRLDCAMTQREAMALAGPLNLALARCEESPAIVAAVRKFCKSWSSIQVALFYMDNMWGVDSPIAVVVSTDPEREAPPPSLSPPSPPPLDEM